MKISKRTDLSILFLANAMIHMRTYLLPTFLTELSENFSLSLFQLGALITLTLVVETISLPLSGYISDRGNRSFSIPVSVLMCGVFLGMIGVFGMKSLSIFVISLIMIGIAAGFYHTAAISLILDLFDEKTRGKAQSIHGTGARIGATIGPIFVGITFLTNRPWSDVYLGLSIPVFLAAILLFLKRVGKNIDQSKSDLNLIDQDGTSALKPVTTVLLGSLIILTLVRTIGAILNEMISFIIPTFLTEQGHSQATAAFLFSWMSMSGAVGVLLGGYGSDRIGPLRLLTLAYVFQGATVAALVVTSGSNLILISIFIFGIASSTTFPAILSLVAQYTPMYRRGMAYAMTSVLPSIFRSVAPTIDGFFAEHRSITEIFGLGIALAVTNVALLPLLKRTEGKTGLAP